MAGVPDRRITLFAACGWENSDQSTAEGVYMTEQDIKPNYEPNSASFLLQLVRKPMLPAVIHILYIYKTISLIQCHSSRLH